MVWKVFTSQWCLHTKTYVHLNTVACLYGTFACWNHKEDLSLISHLFIKLREEEVSYLHFPYINLALLYCSKSAQDTEHYHVQTRLTLLSNTAILNPLLLSNTDNLVRTFWKYRMLQLFPPHTYKSCSCTLHTFRSHLKWGFRFYWAGSQQHCKGTGQCLCSSSPLRDAQICPLELYLGAPKAPFLGKA